MATEVGDESAILGLGEFALRVDDMERMVAFYRDAVGLPVMSEFDVGVFLKVAEGRAGHPQILGLFDRSYLEDYAPPDQARTTLDHLAFEVRLEALEDERNRLEDQGVEVREKTFEGFGWRALFFEDPEGNTVEFVARDPSVTD